MLMLDTLKSKAKALVAGATLAVMLAIGAVSVGVDLGTTAKVGSQIVASVSDAVTIHEASAYQFYSTGVVIEAADVTSVNGSAMNAVGTQYEVLKFIGLFLLIGAAGWVLNKILSIRIG